MTASLVAVAIGTSLMGQTASLSHNATINDGMQYPGRITLSGGGGIYVTEQPTNQVLEYDAAGVLMGSRTIMEGPVGIALHPDGRIFVSRADGAVAYYDAALVPPQGTLDTSNSPYTMVAPNGIAIHPTTGEIYVADGAASMVFVFDPATNQLDRAWGIEGQGLLQLESPLAIALDPAFDGEGGRVLVADSDNFRIHVFSSDGLSGFKFGYRIAYIGMNATAWLARSSGLAVDSCSNIYVADALMGTIRAFSPEGVDLDIANVLVGYGTGVGEVRVPRDLLIDGTTLYVSSTNNGSVEVFDLTCTPAPAPIGDPGDNPPRRKVSGKDRSTGRRTADVDEKSMPESALWVDNPFDVVAAMRDGFYCEEFDLNGDEVIDVADLELAVMAFGAGTVEDFLGGGQRDTYPFSLAPPHMHTHATGSQYPNICGRCHSMNGLPGGMLTAAGQENLCISCHGASGQANHKPIGVAGTGSSHAWGIDATSGGVAGPDPSSPLLLHLDGGLIRCGTCHNPHDSDSGTPYLRLDTRAAELCGSCHTEVEEWRHAGHADEQADPWSHYDWTQSNRASCRMCHSGNGFIDFSNGLASADQSGEFRVLDCSVCHAAHGRPQSEHMIRVFDEVVLPGGVTLTDAGPNATCMTCHNGRYTAGPTHLTPHYLLGGVMLTGINAVEFGATLTNSRHTSVATCVGCHMAASPTSPDPGAGKVGGHSFNMAVHDPDDPDYGFENVENACNASGCHGDTGGLTTLNRLAFGDFDGSGVIEGVQDEVQGLLDIVYTEILATGAVFLGHYPYWDLSGVDPLLEQTVRDAIWNYEYVDNDGSLGVHNTDYAVGALQVTYEALTGGTLSGADLRYLPAGFCETVVTITGVGGGAPVEPGGAFTVDFTVEDGTGAPILIGDLNRLRLYVSGPADNYQIVIPSDSDWAHFVQNGNGTYTYTAVDPFPLVYSAPLNDSPAFGAPDGELTGLPLVDGTYTVLIESRQVFGSIRKAGDATFDFVVANDPLLPPALAPRQVVTRDACNACHNDLQMHGGNRFAVTGCVVCHNAGAEDRITNPETTLGVTINFAEMVHKVHQGHSLPQVAATANGGDPYRYQVIGYGSSVHDFSDVGFPIIPQATMKCGVCHGGAAQGGQAFTAIGRSHCSSCHDDIDFTTGTILDQSNPAVADGLLTEADLSDPAYRVFPGGMNHTLGDDSTCSGCHGAGMFVDAEVAHQHPTVPEQEGTNPVLDIVSIGGMTGGGGTFFQAGDLFEVTFKLRDDTADPLQILAGDTSVLDRLYFNVAGPTVLYQTIIEAQRPWNGGNLAVPAGNWVDNFAVDGTYTFISEDPWPADYPAQLNSIGEPPADQIFDYAGGWGQQYTAGGTPLDNGTYSIIGYGRRVTPVAGQREPVVTDVFDVPFGAGDPIVPYAGTVATDSCSACHGELAFHGNQRWGIEACLACHTAGTQDGGTMESVDFRIMIHKLHNARNLTNLPYELNGYSGIGDFSHLLIPSMPGEAAECHECHTTDAWKTPPVRANMRTWMVACTSCHDSAAAAAHVDSRTLPGFIETCETCHGDGAAYSVETVHATP